MNIQELRARNVLGARDIAVTLDSDVTLFCGLNGAGKSSLQECLRLALQGETVRVRHKKHFPLMVTDGAKEGFVKVLADNQQYEYKLPSGEHIAPAGTVAADQLNCALNAQRFATLSDDERREFLTILTKSQPNKEKVEALLIEAGITQARIDLALPMLLSGFPAACEIAKQKATEAKGAWKNVTGGTWGSLKGAQWEAPEATAPTEQELTDAAAVVAEKETARAELQQKKGAISEKLNAHQLRQASLTDAKTKAGGLARAQDKLKIDQDALDAYNRELAELQAKAGTAPKEGLVHDLAQFLNGIDVPAGPMQVHRDTLIDRYTNEFGDINGDCDLGALAKIPAITKSRDLMQRCVDNDLRDIKDAEAAAAQLATLEGGEQVDDSALTDLVTAIATLDGELTGARAQLATLQELDTAAKEREAKTASAKEHHEDVVGWLKIAEQFAPDGIQSQILAKALEPINKLLRAASIATEWRQVTIAPSMEITAAGRLYDLHSESEKWMIDAMIASVISSLAGLNLVVLDRFDMLDVRHRPALIWWLAELGTQGVQSLIFGTLKEAPKGLPQNVRAIWLHSGEIEEHGLLAA